MRNFRINTGNEQPEEKHGYYLPGTRLIFPKDESSEAVHLVVHTKAI